MEEEQQVQESRTHFIEKDILHIKEVNKTLKAQREGRSCAIQQTKKDINQARAEIKELSCTIGKIKQSIYEITEKLNRCCCKWKEEINCLCKTLSNLEKELKCLCQEYENLQEKLKEEEKLTNNAKLQLLNKQNEDEKWRVVNVKEKSVVMCLKQALELAQKQLNEYLEEEEKLANCNAELEASVKHQKAQADALNEQKESLLADIGNVEKDIDDMKGRIDQFQGTLTGDNAELVNMQKEKEEVENEVTGLKEQHEKMSNCYQERKQVLEKLKRDIIQTQLAIKDLKNKE